MTQARLQRGRLGENLAARRLEEAGWRVLARNARTRFGELDIIALDGRALVFVEVKTVTAGALRGPDRAVLAVGPAKQQRLRRLGSAWLGEQREAGTRLPRFGFIRFDVVGVTLSREGNLVDYEHLEAAF